MKYKKYPSYKDSGVEWLGEVPEHWNINTIKSLLQERKESNNPVKTKDILSLCMYRGVIPYSEKGNSGNKAKEDLTAYKLAYPGDIVLNSMNVVAGSVGLSKYFGAVSPVYYMLRPRSEENKVEFFNDIFQSESFQKSLFGLGNGIMVKQSVATGKLNTIRMRIPMDKLNTVLIPYPPVLEQQQIAKFLDTATQKMDTLIQKQENLIKLLKEKRQAVISHAVTRGLNPDVKFKDSGVEWLGDVPEHWEVGKLKHNLLLINQKVEIKEQEVIALENIESWSGKFIQTDSKYIGEDVAFKKDDVLFGKLRPYLAKVFECPFNGVAFGDILVFRPNKNTDSRYSYYYMISEDFINIVDSSTYGAKMPRASVDFIQNMNMLTVPLEEQQEIAIYLDDKTSKIDTLIEKSEQSIKLLKEKRTALISAAVTGKIDVREVV